MKSPVILTPNAEVSRPLSAFEYFHASVGTSRHNVLAPREIINIVEGEGHLPESRWREALAQVVAANSGCRLRISGLRTAARFESDGLPTGFRVIKDCRWDGRSHVGSEFLRETPLPFDTGPMSELMILESPPGEPARTRVAFRANHAAMDGLGIMHCLHELIRALRGEPLLGSNVSFCDTDLMQHVGAKKTSAKPVKAASLTGPARGDDPGCWWRRVSVHGQCPNSLLRLVTAFAEVARQHEQQLPCVFSLPVNLRRHLPGMNTAQNFGSMLKVPLYPGENAKDFKRKLNAMLAAKEEAAYSPAFDRIKLLPWPWVDWLVQPRLDNFRRKRPFDTCMISHLGYSKSADLSCPGFAADISWGVIADGSTFCAVYGTEKRLEVSFRMPAVYGSEGRFDAVIEHLKRHLNASE